MRKWKRMIFSLPALLALLGVAGLALFPDPQLLPASSMAPDRATLWFLMVCALALQIPPLRKRLLGSLDGATWVLLCAFFVLFHIADRAGPVEGFALKLGFAPDDPVVVSWAARIVCIGALLSFPLWLKRGGVERFVLLGLGLVGAFGLGMFWLLSHFYKVDLDNLAPGPMVSLLVQIVSYAALALCCRAAVQNERVRALVLWALPFLLFVAAARHSFAPIPVPKSDE